MPASGLIEKDGNLQNFDGMNCALKALSTGHVIQFLVLLDIMDKSGHYQYVLCIGTCTKMSEIPNRNASILVDFNQ